MVVLDFEVLDQHGKLIDPVQKGDLDMVGLSRVMADGIAARLVQYQGYTVIQADDFPAGLQAGLTGFQQAKSILEGSRADQVIAGTITTLQSTIVVSARRYIVSDDQAQLVGSSMVHGQKISDAPSLLDYLISDLYPPTVHIVEKPIEQVFLVPGQVRLNVGSSQQITPYALDTSDRPVSDPEFLFFSSDPSKVSVDAKGTITALQPGTASITVRVINRASRSGPQRWMLLFYPQLSVYGLEHY